MLTSWRVGDAPTQGRPGTLPVLPDGGASAVVIGAGFGGIGAALRLRAKGYRVTLIDRLPRAGGRAQQFERDGFVHDAGPTVITAPFLLEELFALHGRDMRDYVDLRPLDTWYRFVFADGSAFDYGGSLDDTLAEIARFDQRDCDGYRRLVDGSQRIFEVGFEQLSDQPFHRPATMFAALPQLVRLRCYRTVWQMVSAHLKNDKLRRAFSIQPLLLGGNPFDTTSIYSLIHFLERRWGVHFPMGGTGALVDGLTRLMVDVGIDVRLGESVEEITVSQGRATGVRLESGAAIAADLVVSNADPAHLYGRMLPRTRRRKWSDARLKRLSYSMGLFVLYFGTKRRYPRVAHHTIVMGESYKSVLDDVFHKKRLPDDLSIYLHRPTATDPSMAPDGCDSFYALAPVPNLTADIDWRTQARVYRDRMIDRLGETVLPGLRDCIAADVCMTPLDFEERYLSRHGAGFSIAPLFRQSAYFRFHNKSEELENLYLVGAGTHPGAGVPGVLSSAKVLDRLVPSAACVR